MLKRTKKLIKRKNSSKEDDRKRQLAEYIKSGRVKKLDYVGVQFKPKKKGDLKHDHRCDSCGGWEDSSGEFQHYDWCPKVSWGKGNNERGTWNVGAGEQGGDNDRFPTKSKGMFGSRRNPISSTKVNRFSPIAELNLGKTSRSNVIINYEDREIVFTGKDAEEIRDIIKYQNSLFRNSSKLKRQYSGNDLNAGGFYLYLTEILRDIYPKHFR